MDAAGTGFADAMWVQVVHSTRLPSKFAGAGVLGVALMSALSLYAPKPVILCASQRNDPSG